MRHLGAALVVAVLGLGTLWLREMYLAGASSIGMNRDWTVIVGAVGLLLLGRVIERGFSN